MLLPYRQTAHRLDTIHPFQEGWITWRMYAIVRRYRNGSEQIIDFRWLPDENRKRIPMSAIDEHNRKVIKLQFYPLVTKRM